MLLDCFIQHTIIAYNNMDASDSGNTIASVRIMIELNDLNEDET